MHTFITPDQIETGCSFPLAGFSPTMQFMLALLAPDSDLNKNNCPKLFLQTIDWDLFLKLVVKHQVYPLVYDRLKTKKIPDIPDYVYQKLAELNRLNRDRMLALTAELVRLAGFFETAGIKFLVFKGPLLAKVVYGDYALRHSGDLDLLVYEKDFYKTITMLREEGYQIVDFPGKIHEIDQVELEKELRRKSKNKHMRFIDKSKSIYLEMHWALNKGGNVIVGFQDIPAEAIVSIETGGRLLYHLNLEYRLLYLSLHGGNHIWSRLKWLLDIGMILSKNPKLDCYALAQKKPKWRGNLFLVQAVLLCEILFGLDHSCHLPPQHAVLKPILIEFPLKMLAKDRVNLHRRSIFDKIAGKRYIAALDTGYKYKLGVVQYIFKPHFTENLLSDTSMPTNYLRRLQALIKEYIFKCSG